MRVFKIIIDIIGTAGDVQSTSKLVDILKNEAPAYWVSSLSVLILLLLLLLIIRLRVYLKLRNSYKKSSKKNYSYSEQRELYDEKYYQIYNNCPCHSDSSFNPEQDRKEEYYENKNAKYNIKDLPLDKIYLIAISDFNLNGIIGKNEYIRFTIEFSD